MTGVESAYLVELLARAEKALGPIADLESHVWMKPPYRRGAPDDRCGPFLCTDIEYAAAVRGAIRAMGIRR